ncbi:hypothetical protein KFE25_010635 [Diacronema lutheri]|uniref:Uncharacterized protein n=1 Tax=Diacronema lutheri TaxID=2081491 RepID=A0A8J6C598_DIALT|nr:hypothetical protein KFE25_010635 [Diacronema lutheri]
MPNRVAPVRLPGIERMGVSSGSVDSLEECAFEQDATRTAEAVVILSHMLASRQPADALTAQSVRAAEIDPHGAGEPAQSGVNRAPRQWRVQRASDELGRVSVA